jgi:hypothetical protein
MHRNPVMLLHLWQRGISLLLLLTILSSAAAAERACPRPPESASHEAGQHHGSDTPAPDTDMECEMMLSCGSAVSMERVSLVVLSFGITPQQMLIAPHYTSPHLRAEAPPPKTFA